MTQSLLSQWTDVAHDSHFTDPKEFIMKVSTFERRVRRRNLIEFAVGLLVIAMFSGSAWLAAKVDDWLLAVGWLLGVIGIVLVLTNLHYRAGLLVRRPEEDCRSHLLGQLRHQRAALQSVAKWYIGPMVPCMVVVLAASVRMNALRSDWITALQGIAGPAAFVIIVFLAVWSINQRAARRLTDEIAQIESTS